MVPVYCLVSPHIATEVILQVAEWLCLLPLCIADSYHFMSDYCSPMLPVLPQCAHICFF